MLGNAKEKGQNIDNNQIKFIDQFIILLSKNKDYSKVLSLKMDLILNPPN